jgi:hypothetical protein
MGDPVSVQVDGRKIWTCCAVCPPKLKAEPQRYLVHLAPPPCDQVRTLIESIIEWTIRNRLLVILASVVLGGTGIRAMRTMPVDAIPDLRPSLQRSTPDAHREAATRAFAWDGRSPQTRLTERRPVASRRNPVSSDIAPINSVAATQFADGAKLNLAHPLARYPQALTDRLERHWLVAVQAIT